MDLILVESPTKSNTIKKFLGKNYEVAATLGHVRDLPKDRLGIDLKNNFEPDYVIPDKAKKTISAIKKLVKRAGKVILATDEDREGESISWHLTQVLGLDKDKKYQRIAFHEITKEAIEQALKNPRDIDLNLVDAQQARRILDRIVGYKLSPFLWKKVAQGLSAGRVQSAAVRLVAEREKEIQNFKAEEYWSITAQLQKENSISLFEAALTKKDGKTIPKLGIGTEKEAKQIVKDLEKATYQVKSTETKQLSKNPWPPFTTSTLQQEAWQRFRFPAKFTMGLAQSLYEKGLTTYHRTDSLNLSETSLAEAKKYICQNFGQPYWTGSFRLYKTKSKSAQEAHEAIRPTDPFQTPSSPLLDEAGLKLYDLIWRRFLACQMAPAQLEATIIEIEANNKVKYILVAHGQTLKFEGFLKVYPLKLEEVSLPSLVREERLKLKKLLPEQHFTQPPNRYSEATLIKALEKVGIGRPSTYAPILDTIQARGYVKKDEKKLLFPTDIGLLVSDLLVSHFPEVVDIGFTARLEESLDKISQGKKEWIPVIQDFYQPFIANLKLKEKEVSKKDVLAAFSNQPANKTDEACPECQSPLTIKLSRFGKFFACSRFPECKYKKNMLLSLGIGCPKCRQGEIVERLTRKRKRFYGCSLWPNCDFALWDKPTGELCPACQGLLVKNKWGKIKCANPECPSQTKHAKPDSRKNP